MRLNRFFVSDYFRTCNLSVGRYGRPGCLNRFFVSDYFRTGVGNPDRQAGGESQSLLRQRLLPDGMEATYRASVASVSIASSSAITSGQAART